MLSNTYTGLSEYCKRIHELINPCYTVANAKDVYGRRDLRALSKLVYGSAANLLYEDIADAKSHVSSYRLALADAAATEEPEDAKESDMVNGCVRRDLTTQRCL